MKWKMVIHPKLLSTFVILLIFGIAIAPSFNAVRITKPIDNIPYGEIDNYIEYVKLKIKKYLNDGCNCYNNSVNTYYPPLICFYLQLFIYSSIVILILTACLLVESGYSYEQGQNFILIFIPPLEIFAELAESLNCPELPDLSWANDPWLNN